MRRLASVSLVLTAVLLSACGYKGPLYLPTNPPAKQKKSNPAPAARPAPATTQTAPEPVAPIPEDQ